MKTNFAARIAGAATLALAALPIAALATGAHAAPAHAVKVADLNLFTDAGDAAFKQRVSITARDFCRNEKVLDANDACRAGVRQEMNEKVAEVKQAQLAARGQTLATR